MAKRKRNQSSVPGTEPNVGKVEHKKQKTDINLIKEAQPAKPQIAEKSETGAAPTSKPQTADEASPPAVTQDEKPLSKSQRKRHRHMQKLREAKKASRSGENPELKDPSNNAAHAVADKEAPVSTGKPDQEEKRKADDKKVSSEKSSKPVTSERSKAPRKSATDVVPNQKHPKSAQKSQKPPRNENEKPIVKPNESKALDAEKPTAPPKAADDKLSKRQRRRQKLHDRKSGVSLDSPKAGQAHHVIDAEALENTTTANILPEVSQKHKHGHLPEPSLMQKITKTTLLPRPEKQWIEQEEGSLQEGNVPDAEKDLHKDLTRTTLLPRPTKQWVREDEPMADETASDSSDVESPQKPVTELVESPAVDRLDDKNASEKRSKTSSPSDSEQSSREERSFAKVGLPTSTETPPTRPGAKTIASFSFSSRRHPADILSNERRSSGLSALRTDAGSFGAYAKPMSSMKANSVPSYSSMGDVKAAFQRFNNFTHNRDEDDSEADSDDSDESDSEVEAEKAEIPSNGHPTTKGAISGQASHPSRVAANVGYAADEDSPVDAIEAIERTPEEESADKINNASESTDSTNEGTTIQEEHQEAGDAGEHATGSSSGSSKCEDDDESEREEIVSEEKVQPRSTDNIQDQIVEDHGFTQQDTTSPQETPNVAIPPGTQAEAESSLPLFGDFNARQPDQTTNTENTHSGSFLGLGHGGNPGGIGAANDLSPANNFPEEKDDLFQSIDEISRDVFGATRPLPDCKPPSNSLDLISEPPVTDDPSNTCLKKNLAKKDMSEKAKVLGNIVRGASPIVWIVNTEEVTGDIVLDNAQTMAEDSSPVSSLSSLTESPTPPIDSFPTINVPTDRNSSEDREQLPVQEENEDDPAAAPARTKRKMTGTTSKHFSPQKSMPKIKEEESSATPVRGNGEDDKAHPPTDPSIKPLQVIDKPKRPSKKQTGTTSTFFTPTPSPTKPTSASKPTPKTPRPPKGTSTSPIPPTTSPHFGLIQEILWDQPFWLLIAVTFLNKTTGRAAVPIFWRLKTLYPTPEALSQAHQTDLVALITTLGLQNQRAKRLISIAKAWIENPPEKARRYRTLHYPARNDGKSLRPDEVVVPDPSEENSNNSCAGALEIGHIPGCGPYAWDSWRIFCRDVARGLAEDYNGRGSAQGFEPEWKRVLPLDKELRACLRWMWLREGWVWDAVTGERREATGEERERGVRGEMVLGDEGEGKFARDAAAAAAAATGVGKEEGADEGGNGAVDDGVLSLPTLGKKRGKGSRRMSIARRELDVESASEEVDSPPAKRARRAGRAQRAKRT